MKRLYDIYKETIDSECPPKNNISMEFLLSLAFHHFWFNNQENTEIRLCNTDAPPNDQLIFKYRNHTDHGFSLQNFSFELLLKRISPANILRIVCALLLERKVVLLFQNYQQNAVIMESIISLLSPLYILYIFIASGVLSTFHI